MTFPKEKVSIALKTLNGTQDSIKGTSKLIKPHAEFGSDVARVFHEEINKAPLANKLLIIYVMHEIMMDTRDRNFVFAFGNVLKPLFTDIADTVDDKTMLGKCLKIFGVWDKELLFKKEFIKKISMIVQNRIDILENKEPQQIAPEPKQDLSASQKNYSKAFMRDYNNVRENELAKAYYDRKAQESHYSKYEEKIKEISDMIRNLDQQRSDPNIKEKIREAVQFLDRAQNQFNGLLLDTTDFMCMLSKKIEGDTRKYISTNYEKYEAFEKQIKRRKELYE